MIDNATAPYGALLLRLAVGAMALGHGLLKAIAFGFGGTAGYFSGLGLPGVLGYLVIIVEVVGGILLLLGVLTRWVALAIAGILAGAVLFAHSGIVQLGEIPPDGQWEYPLFLLVSAIAVSLLGRGALAVGEPKAA